MHLVQVKALQGYQEMQIICHRLMMKQEAEKSQKFNLIVSELWLTSIN
jgi:hypothetical protein